MLHQLLAKSQDEIRTSYKGALSGKSEHHMVKITNSESLPSRRHSICLKSAIVKVKGKDCLFRRREETGKLQVQIVWPVARAPFWAEDFFMFILLQALSLPRIVSREKYRYSSKWFRIHKQYLCSSQRKHLTLCRPKSS